MAEPSPLRKVLVVGKWLAFAVLGYFVLPVVATVGGVLSPFPVTDISDRQPYANVIGREYRLTADLLAIAWNDFPDKKKILSVTLTPPPGTKNRFVSATVPVQSGQRLRIVAARQQWSWDGIGRWYVVSLPDVELPDGPIKIWMNGHGVPDPAWFELVGTSTRSTN